MTANTPEDSALKVGVIDDVMTIINVEGVYFYLYLDWREISKSLEASILSTEENK